MSHYPHRIRLRGPWECEPLARLVRLPDGSIHVETANLPAPRRMTMPRRWQEGGLEHFAGRVRFRRHFGYPGTIDADERVWLLFEGFEGIAQITLNGNYLGEHDGGSGPCDYDVTQLLTQGNDLDLVIESPAESGGLWGDVALEIRATAFLRNVRPCLDAGELAVDGEAVGTSENPLELYVLLDNKTVGYLVVTPSLCGQAFRIKAELPFPLGAPEHTVRVELVNGAAVWFAVEHRISTPDG